MGISKGVAVLKPPVVNYYVPILVTLSHSSDWCLIGETLKALICSGCASLDVIPVFKIDTTWMDTKIFHLSYPIVP